MPRVRVEQISQMGDKWVYQIVADMSNGQYRYVLEYLGEPLEKDLREDMRAWAKSIKVEKEIVEDVEMTDKDGEP